MNKIIGITSSESKTQNFINTAYIKAFNKDNITPIIIPNLFESKGEYVSDKDKDKINQKAIEIAEKLDALILSGGVDLNPVLTNEKINYSNSFNIERDLSETALIKAFIEKKKPILGICRGFQLLGKYMSLNYFQQNIRITKEEHSGTNNDITKRTEPLHEVFLWNGLLDFCKTEINETKLKINSWHNQGFSLHPAGERIKTKDIENFILEKNIFTLEKSDKQINNFNNIKILMSTNYVIEGFEQEEYKIIGYQNHPEEYEDSILLKYFINKYLK